MSIDQLDNILQIIKKPCEISSECEQDIINMGKNLARYKWKIIGSRQDKIYYESEDLYAVLHKDKSRLFIINDSKIILIIQKGVISYCRNILGEYSIPVKNITEECNSPEEYIRYL